jgi:hypothetical protein
VVDWARAPGLIVAMLIVAPPDGPAAHHLAVLRRGPAGLVLVARGRADLDAATDAAWKSLFDGDDGPTQSGADHDAFARFDLAAYVLGDRDLAFGVRSQRFETYAGGGGTFETLHLFRVVDDRIEQVLSEPIGADKLIAGAFDPARRRQHTSAGGEYLVLVDPHRTRGLAELTWKRKDGKKVQRFVFNPKKGRYGVP